MAVPPTIPGGYQLWYYYPSVPGAVIIAIIFFILTVIHFLGIIRTKKLFCIPLIVGGIFEIVGYAARIVAHYNINQSTPYAVQSVLILLAPILFAASGYMYLGRIITAVNGEYYTILKPRVITKIFVAGDIFCFFIQAGGGGMLASAKTNSNVELGQHIILGGLILQILIFLFFVFVTFMFHHRLAIARVQRSLPWQKLLFSLYAFSLLILIRNAVRAVEYGTASNGYLIRHEWTTFIFDGACMVLVLIISAFWYWTTVGSKIEPPMYMESRSGEI